MLVCVCVCVCVHLTGVTTHSYKLSPVASTQHSVRFTNLRNSSVVYSTTTKDRVTYCRSVSQAASHHHAQWLYNISVDQRAKPDFNTVERQLNVSIDGHFDNL